MRVILEELKQFIKEEFRKSGISSKKMLNMDEAAWYLGLKKSTLYKYCCTGKISHFKPNGKLTYFKVEDLDAWMTQNHKLSVKDLNKWSEDY